MFTLALDCSTKATGYAIFQDKTLIKSGCITASSTDLYARIHKMIDGINTLLAENTIDKIVMEEVIPDPTKNNRTYKALSWLQGNLVMAIHDFSAKIEINFIYPGSWRSCRRNGGKRPGEQEQQSTLRPC